MANDRSVLNRNNCKTIRITWLPKGSTTEAVSPNDVANDLIINIEKTPLTLVRISKYTMDKINEKFLKMCSIDYHQKNSTPLIRKSVGQTK